MDLLLRGRGANNSARAPLWLVRTLGATMGFAVFMLADVLSIVDVTGFSPLVLGLVSAVAGALVAPTRLGASLWIAMCTLALTIAIVCYTPVMRTPILQFVRSDVGNTAPVDAVIVLSGSMTEEGLVARDPMVRLLSGINAARERGVRTIALSVITHQTRSRGLVTSEADQRALMQRFAPELELLFVRDVASTRDEALHFLALGRTHRWQRIAVVTSPSHTRRACATFEKLGMPTTCLASEAREYSLRYPGGAHSRLNVFRDVLYETMATLLYAARGWT